MKQLTFRKLTDSPKVKSVKQTQDVGEIKDAKCESLPSRHRITM